MIRKVLTIAAKELLSTYRQPNLLLIMVLVPIVLSTIMGLAFGGLGGGEDEIPDFADIGVAVVNQDEGFRVVSATVDLSLNFGDRLTAILLSQPLTAAAVASGSAGGLALDKLACPLFPTPETAATDSSGSSGSGLDELLNAVAVTDPAAARSAVERGDYAVAVIIPPDFSRGLAPRVGLSATRSITSQGIVSQGVVEVYANNATPLAGTIVRAIVEGIVSRFDQANVALDALVATLIESILSGSIPGGSIPGGSIPGGSILPDAAGLAAPPTGVISGALQPFDAPVLEPLACLWGEDAGNVHIRRQPLDETQTRSTFGILMVILGGAQAVFFSLFTGIFGINSIYEDRRQGTLQRLLATPTRPSAVLAGKLLGNLAVVVAQLLLLLLALTTITSLIERQWDFMWGDNPFVLLLVVIALGMFASSLGVLIVGLARSPEQVQLAGPLISILLGGLGGSFGFMPPRAFAQLSPVWWGLDALRTLSGGEANVVLHLLVLFIAAIVFASLGSFFFRRRLGF